MVATSWCRLRLFYTTPFRGYAITRPRYPDVLPQTRANPSTTNVSLDHGNLFRLDLDDSVQYFEAS